MAAGSLKDQSMMIVGGHVYERFDTVASLHPRVPFAQVDGISYVCTSLSPEDLDALYGAAEKDERLRGAVYARYTPREEGESDAEFYRRLIEKKYRLDERIVDAGNGDKKYMPPEEKRFIRQFEIANTQALVNEIKEGLEQGFARQDPSETFAALSKAHAYIRDGKYKGVFIRHTKEADETVLSLLGYILTRNEFEHVLPYAGVREQQSHFTEPENTTCYESLMARAFAYCLHILTRLNNTDPETAMRIVEVLEQRHKNGLPDVQENFVPKRSYVLGRQESSLFPSPRISVNPVGWVDDSLVMLERLVERKSFLIPTALRECFVKVEDVFLGRRSELGTLDLPYDLDIVKTFQDAVSDPANKQFVSGFYRVVYGLAQAPHALPDDMRAQAKEILGRLDQFKADRHAAIALVLNERLARAQAERDNALAEIRDIFGRGL